MTHQLQGVLDVLTRVRGVQGAMFVARDDGLVIAETLMEGVRGKALAALAASVFGKFTWVSGTAKAGEPRFLHMQCTEGAVLVLATNQDVLVVIVTDTNTNVGLVRLEMLRAGEVFA